MADKKQSILFGELLRKFNALVIDNDFKLLKNMDNVKFNTSRRSMITAESGLPAMIEQTIKRLTAERKALDKQMKDTADLALMDWLLLAACADYDTIELDPAITGKAHRKQFKALRDQKRNLDKILAAVQDLQQAAKTPEGERLRKKYEAELEKYGSSGLGGIIANSPR